MKITENVIYPAYLLDICSVISARLNITESNAFTVAL